MILLLRKSNKSIAGACREKIRNTKVQFEIQLARDKRSNIKQFYKYVKRKRKTKKSIGSLLNEKGNLVKDRDLPKLWQNCTVEWLLEFCSFCPRPPPPHC